MAGLGHDVRVASAFHAVRSVIVGRLPRRYSRVTRDQMRSFERSFSSYRIPASKPSLTMSMSDESGSPARHDFAEGSGGGRYADAQLAQLDSER
jgi:hypothetical protein